MKILSFKPSKKKIEEFSIASGLIVNPAKSNLFLAGVSPSMRASLYMLLGYEEGVLPVKYLGVPLSSARVSHMHCQELVNKIQSKVKAWGSYKLTYAGRLELVKSVLFSIHTYWTGIYLLPKRTVQLIDKICCDFIWGSREGTHKIHLISWQKMCMPKEAGGLGLIQAEVWNKIAMVKILWTIHMKQDVLWIKWLHEFYLKTYSIWEVKARVVDSWFWKKVLSIRDLLIEKSGSVDAVLVNFDHWTCAGKFSMTRALHYLYYRDLTPVLWSDIIWKGIVVPRHSFIMWITMWGRLLTQSRLMHLNVVHESKCILCHHGHEDLTHIFFQCPFSALVWKKILSWLCIDRDPLPFPEEIAWFIAHAKGRAIKKKVVCAAFAAALYQLWRERNARRFQSSVSRVNTIVKRIQIDVIARVLKSNVSPQVQFWISNL